MRAHCICVTADGERISGTAEWLPEEAEHMSAEEQIRILEQLRSFAGFCSDAFLIPLGKLEKQSRELDMAYGKNRSLMRTSSFVSMGVTLLWLISAFAVRGRFSTASFVLAFLTMVCLGGYLPVLLRYVSQSEIYRDRKSGLDRQKADLIAWRNQKLFQDYPDLLVSGFVLLQGLSLNVAALDAMRSSLSEGTSGSLWEAAARCEGKFSGPVLLVRCESMELYGRQNKMVHAENPVNRAAVPSLKQISMELQSAADRLEKMQEAVTWQIS